MSGQATCRGALVRHRLRHHPTTAPFAEQRTPTPHKKAQQQQQHHHHHQHQPCQQHQQRQCSRKKQTGTSAPSEKLERRCPERAAWEQTWARVLLQRPNFRDRVRVWQTISELKRSGGTGRMGITNSEAWRALYESSGSALVAATMLSSEEYLLGRRLQEPQLCDVIPSYLSLDRASLSLGGGGGGGGRNSAELPSPLHGGSVGLSSPLRGSGVGGFFSPLRRRRRSSSSPSTRTSAAKSTIGLAREGGQGSDGVFECISDMFYSVSTAPTTTEGRKSSRSSKTDVSISSKIRAFLFVSNAEPTFIEHTRRRLLACSLDRSLARSTAPTLAPSLLFTRRNDNASPGRVCSCLGKGASYTNFITSAAPD